MNDRAAIDAINAIFDDFDPGYITPAGALLRIARVLGDNATTKALRTEIENTNNDKGVTA